jgi:hypothetical protein
MESGSLVSAKDRGGIREMADGGWRIADGGRLMADIGRGEPPSAFSHQPSAITRTAARM